MFAIYTVALVLGAAGFAIAAFLAVVLIAGVPRVIWLAARGTTTTGTVVRIDRRRPGGSAQVRVAYETPGGTFETRATSQRPRVGEPIPVRYDPARPKRAAPRTASWRVPAVGIPVTLVLAAATAGMIVSAVWYFAGSYPQLQEALLGGSFALAAAMALGSLAWRYCSELLRWRQVVQADGKVLRIEEPPAGVTQTPGRILISFQTADGPEKFWAVAGTVIPDSGDHVTVYYDPARPAISATVQSGSDVRTWAIASTILALALAVGAVYMFTQL